MKNIMKKTVSVLLALVVLVGAFSALALAADEKLVFEVNDFGKATLVSASKELVGEVSVPASVEIDGEEYEVQSIGDYAFSGCEKVTSITLAEGTVTIGNKAFENCAALTTVNVPKSLISCQYDAFDGCGKVTVNCYKNNYQFFAVYGFNENVVVNVLDAGETPEQNKNVNGIIDLIKNFIYMILSFLGIKIEK